MTEEKPPRRLGDRNESRLSRPFGVPVTPAVPVHEFSDRPITNVEMAPAEELVARIERTRSATKSSEIAITARLNQQDHEIAGLRSEVSDVKGSVSDTQGVVTEIRVEVAEIRGELKTLPQLVQTVKDSADRMAQREHTIMTKHLEVTTAREVSAIEVDTARKLDTIDARKLRRRAALKLIGVLGAGGVVAELVHWLIARVGA